MKRYFALIITVVILSLSLCLPSLAAKKKVITLSEDYKKLYFAGNTYTRVDASMLDYTSANADEEYEPTTDVVYQDVVVESAVNLNSFYTTKLTEAQHNEVKMIEITDVNQDETLFFICISFKDGAVLYIDFIREDLVDEYTKVINGETKKYYIDFRYPEGNIVTTDKESFLNDGKKAQIDFFECDMDFTVYADSLTESFDAQVGAILLIEEKYYYYSFINSDIKTSDELWMYEDMQLEVIEITDEALLEEFKKATESYYGDDYGYLYNESFTEPVAKIFFSLVFAVFPLAVAVTTLVLASKSKKGLYKKLLFTTSGLSLASLAVFVYIVFTLFNK